MGTFVNVLALRVQISPSTSFRDLIQQVSIAVREGRDHQDFPFPLLVERLRVPRDTSRTPIFQTYFTLQRLHHQPDWLSFFLPTHTPLTLQIGDMKVGTLPLAQQEGQMEIAVHVYDVNNELFLEYKYNTDLFDQGTIEQMMRSYEAIVSRAIDGTDWLLSSLPSARLTLEHVARRWKRNPDFCRKVGLNGCFHQRVACSKPAGAQTRNDRQVSLASVVLSLRWACLSPRWVATLVLRTPLASTPPDKNKASPLQKRPRRLRAPSRCPTLGAT